ncbi:VOC family protein [Salinarchaeum laminariae]|uniref:VOC family protein n=1 Tax=Salinarchaeum laminariae TaxID=869888 RepID=UPI0020BDAD19|nr:VOC family protein [Salinarchaeum laminariae]
MSTDALPAAAGIGRVHLRVADLDEAVAFYQDVIGLDRLDPDTVEASTPAPDGAELQRAVFGVASDPLLVLDAAPDAPNRSPAEAGLYHLAIRVPDRATLGAAIARLRERDLIDGAADHGVSEAIYCRDPAGNGLELYVDRPRAEWPMAGDRVEMGTDPLDLDALVALADDGESSDRSGALPAGTTIGHVHLEVTDLDATDEFYADLLGMGPRQRMGDQALFLAAGEYHHHVGANTWRRRSAPIENDSLGLESFEVVLPDDDALDAAAARFEDAGITVERPADGVAAVFDPDGIAVRLRVDGAIAAPTGE